LKANAPAWNVATLGGQARVEDDRPALLGDLDGDRRPD